MLFKNKTKQKNHIEDIYQKMLVVFLFKGQVTFAFLIKCHFPGVREKMARWIVRVCRPWSKPHHRHSGCLLRVAVLQSQKFCSFPDPDQEKHLHSMMLASPCVSSLSCAMLRLFPRPTQKNWIYTTLHEGAMCLVNNRGFYMQMMLTARLTFPSTSQFCTTLGLSIRQSTFKCSSIKECIHWIVPKYEQFKGHEYLCKAQWMIRDHLCFFTRIYSNARVKMWNKNKKDLKT